jgi:sRNA-binding carbon storage regulator CsrA
MLVLTRYKEQAVLIGPEVVVTVREFGADEVLVEVVLPAGMSLQGPQGVIPTAPAEGGATPAGSPVAKGFVRLKEGDRLRIGAAIAVKAARLVSNTDGFSFRVRLGFEAPADVHIVRQEVSKTGPAEEPRPAPDDIP